MNNLLNILHIKKNYITDKEEIEAIKDITLSIEKGEIVTIVGSSGCGKSSLLSILAGIEKATSGTFLFHKENPIIGYMLQSDALFPWLTVYENALIGLKISKKDLTIKDLSGRATILYGLGYLLFMFLILFLTTNKIYFILINLLGIFQISVVIINGFMVLYKKEGIADKLTKTRIEEIKWENLQNKN